MTSSEHVRTAQRVVDAAREFCDPHHAEDERSPDGTRCDWCAMEWPCPTQRLTEAIDEWDEGE
jgi:hypothetical protein